MSYPLTPCFVCGAPAKDWGGNYTPYCCCQKCTIRVHNIVSPGYGDSLFRPHNGEPTCGDAFPPGCATLHATMMDLKAKRVSKYGNICPCGIATQQCTYHGGTP